VATKELEKDSSFSPKNGLNLKKKFRNKKMVSEKPEKNDKIE